MDEFPASNLAELPPQDPRGKRLRRWIPGVGVVALMIALVLMVRFVLEEAPVGERKKATPLPVPASTNHVPDTLKDLAAAAKRQEPPPPPPGPSARELETAALLKEALARVGALESQLREAQQKPAEITEVKPEPTPAPAPKPKPTMSAQELAEAKRLAQERAREAKAEASRKKAEDAAAKKARLHWERESKTSEVGTVKTVASPYSLMPGWTIPCSLKYALSSRAPGPIVAYVTQNVYDSATGEHLLIPQTATLMGDTTGGTVFGDDTMKGTIRQMVVGKQIYTLGQAPVQDKTGQTGLKDQVETFWGRALLSIGLKSVLQAGAASVSAGADDVGQRVAGSVAQQSAAEGSRQVQQLINIAPRLTVRQAYRCAMTISEPISFSQPYTPLDAQVVAYRAKHGW